MEDQGSWYQTGQHECLLSYFIAVAEHGREDALQQRQHVFIGLEQAAHRLQLHHVAVGTFSD